ncbi:SoxR reducing system RseC family protein [Vibrio ruber]|uniref:SoxR reducing system protein RseC n=1 Tax=Vibrio ruber (strain DSM 16370 / JCM 11486 / BCRC 17186 / CECT 7878 / LMG 23124 / VR1) TaxID=1123498 RepID=A0A1R4L963_VIBR1|nr:SoxR reducing system RseC family protein [Vibrio ruber]WNJ96208.1 SoxR reducing system RseC family protein [Vibrio ruber]SJN53082.1 SoxR reducing system protein RseC [Vibrio ruber DSM 16370]
MMTALATVDRVHETAGDYQVELSCQQQTSCSQCASSSSCSTGVVSKAIGKKVLTWQLHTSQPIQTGQMVEIGFPEKSLLQSAAIVYLLPLFMMIFGCGIGQLWLAPLVGGGEPWVIACTILFTAGGVWLAKILARRMEQVSLEEVVLLRVLGEPIVRHDASK